MKRRGLERFSWNAKLEKLVVDLTKKAVESGGTAYLNAFSSRLRGIAFQIDLQAAEPGQDELTLVLTHYPDMPPRFLALHFGVEYALMLKLYKRWHVQHGKKPPKTGRLSYDAVERWYDIINHLRRQGWF